MDRSWLFYGRGQLPGIGSSSDSGCSESLSSFQSRRFCFGLGDLLPLGDDCSFSSSASRRMSAILCFLAGEARSISTDKLSGTEISSTVLDDPCCPSKAGALRDMPKCKVMKLLTHGFIDSFDSVIHLSQPPMYILNQGCNQNRRTWYLILINEYSLRSGTVTSLNVMDRTSFLWGFRLP